MRTSWVCGAHGDNMVKTVLRLADRAPSSRSSTTSAAAPPSPPTWPKRCATWPSSACPGTCHITNQGAVTWYGFVRDVLAAVGEDPDRVRPITTAELDPPRPAHRPANSVLDNAALRAAGFPPLQHYRDALNLCLMELDALG